MMFVLLPLLLVTVTGVDAQCTADSENFFDFGAEFGDISADEDIVPSTAITVFEEIVNNIVVCKFHTHLKQIHVFNFSAAPMPATVFVWCKYIMYQSL